MITSGIEFFVFCCGIIALLSVKLQLAYQHTSLQLVALKYTVHYTHLYLYILNMVDSENEMAQDDTHISATRLAH